MDKENNTDIFRTYKLDYMGKYEFYEKDDLIKSREDGEYILENLSKSNRFDYDGASYTFTKFGNISEGKTDRDVNITIYEDDYNVKINDEIAHLDLIYKMDIKELEDHFRITTRVSEKGRDISCLLYINLKDSEDFINALTKVKENQIKLSNSKIENGSNN